MCFKYQGQNYSAENLTMKTYMYGLNLFQKVFLGVITSIQSPEIRTWFSDCRRLYSFESIASVAYKYSKFISSHLLRRSPICVA